METTETINEIPDTTPQPKKGGSRGSGWLLILLVIALLVLGFMYYQKTKELKLIQDPAAQAEYAKKVSEKAIADLKDHVVIAEGEDPVLLGIVSDAEALRKQQAFYATVEADDQIFIFQKSSRALIWRPSTKQVVNFGVLDVQATDQKPVQKQPAPTATTTKK